MRREVRRSIGDLTRLTSQGRPVIVRIEGENFSHWIVVDGVSVRNTSAGRFNIVAVRDPHGKAYFVKVEDFKSAFTGEILIPCQLNP